MSWANVDEDNTAGFVAQLIGAALSTLTPDDLRAFAGAPAGADADARARLALALPFVRDRLRPSTELWRGKSAEKSAAAREAGNAAYAAGRLRPALAFYTAAAMMAPVKCRRGRSLEEVEKGACQDNEEEIRIGFESCSPILLLLVFHYATLYFCSVVAFKCFVQFLCLLFFCIQVHHFITTSYKNILVKSTKNVQKEKSHKLYKVFRKTHCIIFVQNH